MVGGVFLLATSGANVIVLSLVSGPFGAPVMRVGGRGSFA